MLLDATLCLAVRFNFSAIIPPADYLPSPLDVNNFALDLDKDEEKVLLPCSRWAAYRCLAVC